jgi:hypothetical protein
MSVDDESMRPNPSAAWLLEQEARALLTRLALVKPFVVHETCHAAAAKSPETVLGHRGAPDRRPAGRARCGPGVHPLDSGCGSARAGS